jgi:hypothetical protein
MDLGWGVKAGHDTSEYPQFRVLAWRYTDATNRLLARAGRASDLCGLALAGVDPIWTGGYTYLHRDLPFFRVSPRALAAGDLTGANYVIASNTMAHSADLTLVAAEGDTNLYRRDGACGPPPADYSRLFPAPR